MLSSDWRNYAAVSPISRYPVNRATWDDSKTRTPNIDADTSPCEKPSLPSTSRSSKRWKTSNLGTPRNCSLTNCCGTNGSFAQS